MKEYNKSVKLEHVAYDIRGPVLEIEVKREAEEAALKLMEKFQKNLPRNGTCLQKFWQFFICGHTALYFGS